MATAKKAPAKAEGTKAPAAKRAPNAAFLKPLTPSPLLAAVIGAAPLPRTEVTKKRSDGSEYTGTRGARIARKTGKEI